MKKAMVAMVTMAMVALSGCSAIQNRNLAIDSKMSQTVFLNAEKLSEGSPIYVRFANTSGYMGADFQHEINIALKDRGYKITKDATKASYILQANLLYLGEEGKGMTAEGALIGGVGGAGTGAAVADGTGAMIGGGLGASLGALAGSVLSVDTLLGVVDIQVEERNGRELKPVRCRIVTTAKQFEMDKETAKYRLSKALVNQIAGIF